MWRMARMAGSDMTASPSQLGARTQTRDRDEGLKATAISRIAAVCASCGREYTRSMARPDQDAFLLKLQSHNSTGFRLVVNYRPRGDQENAIAELIRGTRDGEQHQVLLGVTGSGKTFTIAKVIEAIGRPALVLAHNKTLAAQLYHEFKAYFPDNAVEYFVSYYDYYQPESYIPSSDVYIEKESTINDELDKLRLSATKSLVERRDGVVV